MGLYCYPWLRNAAVTAYFITAIACALIGVTAKSIVKRAIPMLILLLLRFGIVLTRLCLKSGSWWASLHFLWMEVRPVMLYSMLADLQHLHEDLPSPAVRTSCVLASRTSLICDELSCAALKTWCNLRQLCYPRHI